MTLFNDFLSLFYPRYCPACGILLFHHEQALCRLCRLNLPRSDFHLKEPNKLSLALGGRVPLQKSLCLFLFEKSGKVQKLVHAIKYKGQQELASSLGRMLGADFLRSEQGIPFDLILPVPLHPSKQKARGYNQSEAFARGLSQVLKLPIDTDKIKRTRHSQSQTNRKKYQRWENVEGIFECTDQSALSHKHVLVVDDVVTTGATLEALWQCIKDVEGIQLSVACLGFAKTEGV